MTTESASVPEIVWTLVTLIGFGVTLWGLWDAVGDLDYVRQHGLNGTRKLVAWSNVRAEAVGAAVLGLFASVGVVALFTPPRPDSGAAGLPAFYPLYVAAAASLAAVLLVLQSLLNRRDRTLVIAFALVEPNVETQIHDLTVSVAAHGATGVDTNIRVRRIEDAAATEDKLP